MMVSQRMNALSFINERRRSSDTLENNNNNNNNNDNDNERSARERARARWEVPAEREFRESLERV